MPAYDYDCELCGKSFEISHGMREEARRDCPACGQKGLTRRIGSGVQVMSRGAAPSPADWTGCSRVQAGARPVPG